MQNALLRDLLEYLWPSMMESWPMIMVMVLFCLAFGAIVVQCLIYLLARCWSCSNLLDSMMNGAIKAEFLSIDWKVAKQMNNKRWAQKSRFTHDSLKDAFQTNYLVHQPRPRITLITHRTHTANPFLQIGCSFDWISLIRSLWYFHEAGDAARRREPR